MIVHEVKHIEAKLYHFWRKYLAPLLLSLYSRKLIFKGVALLSTIFITLNRLVVMKRLEIVDSVILIKYLQAKAVFS